jgi:hypothetical protein
MWECVDCGRQIEERKPMERYVLKGWLWGEFEDEERFFRKIFEKMDRKV